MNIHLQQTSKHIPMSETILETIRTLNIQAQKYSESQKEVAYSYSLDAKNLATSYLSQLGSNSEIPLSSSIDDESFVRAVKKELVIALSSLTYFYNISNDFEKSIEIINEGIPIAKECAMEFHVAQFLLNFGICYFRKNEIFNSLKMYEDALEIVQYLTTPESSVLYIKILNNIGNVYTKLNEYEQALEYYQFALEVKSKRSLPDKVFALTYLNVGMCFAAINKLDASLEYYELAAKIAKENNDMMSLALVLNNMGNHWSFQNDLSKALNLFQESIEIKKSLNLEYGLDTTYYNIALVLAKQSRYKECLNFAEEAFSLAKKYNNTKLLGDIYIFYADINSTKENQNKSLEYAIECLNQLHSIPNLVLDDDIQSDVFRIQATIAELNGNYEESLQLYKQYSELEKKFVENQFSVQDKLLREQLEYERNKAKVSVSTETTIQIEALRKENANVSSLLERTKENVTTLLEQKNDLIRMASHDLKNPLNNILGFAEYLLKEIPMISTDDIKEYATYIRDSAQRMTTIITTILDVNKSGTSTINVTLQKTDVATIVQTLIREYSQYAHSKNITVTQNIHSQRSICETDTDLLKQIIDNIFSNAIKYSSLGSNVTVTLRSQDNIVTNNEEKSVEPVVIVEIEDKGPGFTEDDRINMFGTYAKLSAKPTAGEHSTGLGLSIVKKLSELINVSVWCESTIGEGSTFFIEIPELHK
jgi:signal transduction histidine kinase/tetratricopeptide (TPR) repeat protein